MRNRLETGGCRISVNYFRRHFTLNFKTCVNAFGFVASFILPRTTFDNEKIRRICAVQRRWFCERIKTNSSGNRKGNEFEADTRHLLNVCKSKIRKRLRFDKKLANFYLITFPNKKNV